MAITPLPFPTPAGVVGEAGVLWSTRTDGELVAGLEELLVLQAKTAALEAELLAEVDAREVPKRQLAWGSTTDWYAHLAGTTRRQAKRTVAQAARLTRERSATHQALQAGTVSPDQAGLVVAAVEQLPLTGDVRARGEAHLLEQAARLDAIDLRRAARHLVAVVDPEGEDRKAERDLDREERAAHLDRNLSITDDGCGGVRIKGRGSIEDAATLRAALLPLTAPQPSVAPTTCAETPDPRDHGARLWDALTQLAQHALDCQVPPASHGTRPRVSITIDHHDLHDSDEQGSGAGTGVSEDGLGLSAAAVRRLACDCDLVRVLLDAEGCVLDVGRTHRLVTSAIWTALVARDSHCAFPTCLDNLVLLCGHHHRTLHHTPWKVRLAADRRPEFLPAPRPGRPPPEWTRHRSRRE